LDRAKKGQELPSKKNAQDIEEDIENHRIGRM